MKWNSGDTKALFIGILASASAVVLWDVVKKSLGIFNYEVKNAKTPILDEIDEKLKGKR